jgi:multiple sugar transport system ATP-binding protein
MAEIRFDSIQKTFGKFTAVDDVDLEVRDGEFLVLLGPSGCGKTTLLRCLAGLERVDGGRVLIGGRDVTDEPPRSRRIAMVFQSYAVFPHMKVYDNIAFGLRMQKESKAATDAAVQSAAALLHIESLLDRYSSQLSGGQRQRVAVARAMATKADVLLMDEPLSNLDALLRLEMRAELKALLQNLETTTIYVTHDQIEALSMGDRIAVMNAGKIVQLGNPLEVYDDPADVFVGGFIGNPPMNFLDAEVAPGDRGSVVTLSGGSLKLADADLHELAGRKLTLGIRAEAIGVENAPGNELIRAELIVLEPLGSHNLLTVRCGEDRLKVSVHPSQFPETGGDVWLRLEPSRIRWMDRESGTAIPVAGSRPASPVAEVLPS